MNSEARKTVALIGLGAIACRQWGGPEDATAFNHAGGILHGDAVRLIAAADPSPTQRAYFSAVWAPHMGDVRLYDDYQTMLDEQAPDIVAVCTKTPLHYEASCAAIAAGTQALFLEKPMACALWQADDILAKAAAAGVTVTVAYARHWGPHLSRIADFIAEGHLGRIRAAIGYLGGGVLHFGSHVTDMLCMFLGYSVTAVSAKGVLPDYADGPPAGYIQEPFLNSMLLEFAHGVQAYHVGAASDCGVFRVDLFCEHGRAQIPYHGTPLVVDAKGHEVDLDAFRRIQAASPYSIAYREIARHLDGGPAPACTGGEALHVHEVGVAAVESMRCGRRVELPLTDRALQVWSVGTRPR